ncbi:MAG: 3-hydroxyacyl-CoA dehydrogenase NAD-binding domain-containing protein [Actinomycetota bacterium]|nr:3-hydroxyacyl-CoA dehydrogenase NAD-binding domain-containing protein [Actinomycetota bacterium]
MSAPSTIGVVGAGTMGAGIAQLAGAAGMQTRLHDPVPEALARGMEGLRRGLVKLEENGRLEDAKAAAARVLPASSIEGMAGCELVIEAAPERAELKRELFARLSEACGPDAVLATNTSSIPVTSLAGAAARPENVVGMHFFNPPALMKLLEVIPAEQTGERALAVAQATGEAMGKRVIVAPDGPGFLVNRCGRPFSAEALRIVQEGVAAPEQVDRICRLGGGFRMGPFELSDLVGIDVGLEVARSFTELSFGEPRWKPSPLQARMVAAGRLGRKSGRGWYEYGGQGPYRAADPERIEPAGDAPPVRLVGAPAELLERAAQLGLTIDAPDGPVLVSCRTASLAAQCGPADACGILIGPPLEGATMAEATRLPTTAHATVAAAERFLAALGLRTEWVGDAPGLVLRRIMCQLVNEAAFAIGEGLGSAEDVDTGMTLGLNHPRGPVAWSEVIGPRLVLETIDGLWAERREERYRAAPLLRRAAALGASSISEVTGA